MGRRHRLILYEKDTGAVSILDIIELPDLPSGDRRFDELVVLLRRARKEMESPKIHDAVLDFHIGGDSRLQHTLPRSFESPDTWVRNRLLELIEALADLGP